MRVRALALVLAGVVCRATFAYETETHALMTNQAYVRSNLNPANGQIIHNLGLDRLDSTDPFAAYWDVLVNLPQYFDEPPGSAGTALPFVDAVFPGVFEECQMQEFLALQPGDIRHDLFVNTVDAVGGGYFTLPVQNWLVRGAIREDDLGTAVNLYTYAGQRCGALDILPTSGNYVRVLNHFYDPIFNVSLTCPLGGTCQKSVDWALGVVDSFPTPPQMPQVDTNRRNHFSYEDARNNFWWALTKETGLLTPPYIAANRKLDAKERAYRWASTFRMVGDIVHLLQDTSQPQHVRNDPHSGFQSPEQQALEGFTNARVLSQPVGSIGGAAGDYLREFFGADLSTIVAAPPLGAYPIVTMATPVRFFTTRNYNDTSSTNPSSRFGLADYTNRGLFTGGTLPGASTNPYSFPPQTVTGANGYTAVPVPCMLPSPKIFAPPQAVSCTHYTRAIPDTVASSYSSQDVLPAGFTAPPVVADGVFAQSIASYANGTTYVSQKAVGVEELITTANLTIPRAIGYSTGMINYFFRGQLSVTAPPDKIVGVLNQGAPHTMNSQGYPCAGGSASDGCALFGFQSIRVSVKNATAAITESGSATVIAQNLASTAVGSVTDTNFHGPYLVAVARYHRNSCYKTDLSGEPYQIYNPTPPATGITQPTCGSGQTTRTAYQEISVSKSAGVTAAQLNGSSPVEVHFDFSADPIPVNATDLFIQVVYRGPMGDSNVGSNYVEPDGIALGTLDVREPTFVAFWNNTDYFWNNSWIHENTTNHNEGIESFWSCMGGFPLKMVFEYDGGIGTPAMIDPIVSSTKPGMVRLAAIYPPPDFAGQLKNIQGTPVHYPGDQQIAIEQSPTSGMFRQANLENVSASTLSSPYAGCASGLPTAAQYWCFDPIQKRRGQLFGTPDIPFFINLSFSTASDVDSVPLPVFTGTVPLTTGTVRFDTDATLASCAAQPASASPNSIYEAYLKQVELIQEARDLGVSEETEAPLQREVPESQR